MLQYFRVQRRKKDENDYAKIDLRRKESCVEKKEEETIKHSDDSRRQPTTPANLHTSSFPRHFVHDTAHTGACWDDLLLSSVYLTMNQTNIGLKLAAFDFLDTNLAAGV